MTPIKAQRRTITAGIGIIAVSALLMTGCSAGDEEAEFADATETASDLEPTDPDLLTVPQEDDLGKIVTTDAVDAGDESNIVVPSGELKVSGISSVEQVPQTVIDSSVAPEDAEVSDEEEVPSGTDASASPAETEDGEALGPAEGKKLSLVTVDYTANEEEPGHSSDDDPLDTSELASPTLGLDLDGQTRELPKLDEDGHRTYLMSLPAEGTAELVVTQDGHEQRLDLNTGKRTADDVAAAYYREKTDPVEINEPLAFPDSTVTVEGSISEDDYTVKLTTELAEAQLTPWTEEKGWADNGTAWLLIDGKAGIEPEASLTPSTAKITYSIGAEDEKDADFEVTAKGYRADFSEILSVPADTEKLEVTGTAKVHLKATGSDIKGENPLTVKTKQPYEIDFGPANSSPSSTSQPSQEESTGGSSDEPTDEASSSATVETDEPGE